MKLTVVLGASSEASFDIILYNNDFVRKWVKELQWCLDNSEFNQSEAFASFLTLQASTNILTQSCLTINSCLKNFIEIKEDLVNQPREYFNYLHSKFELLSGKYGKPTRFFLIATKEIKAAIRNLNFFVHRVESKKDSFDSLYLSFIKDQLRRIPLEKSDYEYFTFNLEPGTLFLHYVELGKNFTDLYEDRLELDYAGFANLHYYSGEASLTFNECQILTNGLIDWLTARGIDPYNKHLGHGKIPLGKLTNLDDARAKLREHRYINTILIKE